MTWYPAASANQVNEGEILGVTVAEKPVALYRINGEIFASHNICTHAYACLSDGYLEEGVIECPLHQARYEVRTGKVLSGPTRVPLPVYPVRLEGEDVMVDLPDGPISSVATTPLQCDHG